MHRIIDLSGGVYLDAKTLAGAGLRPGDRVRVEVRDGEVVLWAGRTVLGVKTAIPPEPATAVL